MHRSFKQLAEMLITVITVNSSACSVVISKLCDLDMRLFVQSAQTGSVLRGFTFNIHVNNANAILLLTQLCCRLLIHQLQLLI